MCLLRPNLVHRLVRPPRGEPSEETSKSSELPREASRPLTLARASGLLHDVFAIPVPIELAHAERGVRRSDGLRLNSPIWQHGVAGVSSIQEPVRAVLANRDIEVNLRAANGDLLRPGRFDVVPSGIKRSPTTQPPTASITSKNRKKSFIIPTSPPSSRLMGSGPRHHSDRRYTARHRLRRRGRVHQGLECGCPIAQRARSHSLSDRNSRWPARTCWRRCL